MILKWIFQETGDKGRGLNWPGSWYGQCCCCFKRGNEPSCS